MNMSPSAVLLLITALFIGCASDPPLLDSSLDGATGWTLVTTEDPIVLARGTPRIAHSARDYVYLGPVEVNRMGLREHYLWVAMVSTVDRAPIGETPITPQSLTVLADDTPMELTLTPWGEELPTPAYETAAPPYAVMRARVSLHQVERIAQAGSVAVFLTGEDDYPLRYRVWQGRWPQWGRFAAAPAASGQDRAVATLE